jgi:amino acid permease
MKKAAMYGIGATTIFYISVGCAGYAAFGSDAPGNILTAGGLGPFWLVDIANMCLILHLIGAYQVSQHISVGAHHTTLEEIQLPHLVVS